VIADVFDHTAKRSISRAMALGRVDMILVRPWDPPDHWLYPRISVLLDTSALFILVGAQPRTDWLPGTMARDDAGFLLTGPDLAPAGGMAVGWTLARSPLPMEPACPPCSPPGTSATDQRNGWQQP
jgi:hypothetical protein